jgi:competence protein ComEC
VYIIRSFFNLHPALAYAFSAIIGIEASLQGSGWLLLLAFCFWALFLPDWKRLLLGSSVAAAAFFLTHATFHFSLLPPEGAAGYAWIQIDQLSHQSSRYAPSWIYKGRIQEFSGDNGNLKGVPFFMAIPDHKGFHPVADRDYLLHCTVQQGRGKGVILKPIPNSAWEPVERSSFAEARFSAKQAVKGWIAAHFTSSIAVSFLSGLVTGEFDDPGLRKDFGRFGLLHILAISGFHFAIFAQGLTYLFRPFLSPKRASLAVMGLLSVYFFFLGWGPSVVRAWMTILLFFSANFKGRLSSSLNSLGLALLFSALLDPLLLENLGFQFSFLATGAILLGFEPALSLLHRVFPTRPLKEVLEWPILDRLAFMLLGYMKNNFAISLATTLIALPMSLYYFQTFPLLSLIYNLFFPTLVSISMSLLLLGLIFTPIPWIANGVHKINDYATSFILNLTSDIPEKYDFFLTSPPFPATILIIYNITILIIFIYCRKPSNELQ